MPGITGIIAKTPNRKHDRDLNIMVNCMMHEPFYTSGTYADNNFGFYTGWVCRRNSFDDCMPVFNEKKDIVLMFCGEDFAGKETIERLERNGHVFNKNNAEYLIHLYEDKGEDFFGSLNGLFSGIILDLRNGRAILFNDRFGMHRIYYHENENAFYFSSEAKSLLKVLAELREIDLEALGEYLCCGSALLNKSLFSGISLLPAGSAWKFKNSRLIEKNSYFRPDLWESLPQLGKKDFYENLLAKFPLILQRYLKPNGSVAMSLTGGLDSRMIMAWAKNIEGSLPCYTFGSLYRDNLDVIISRKVADACKQKHFAIPVDEKFLSEFYKYAERTIYITDGSLDVSSSPELYVNTLGREIAPVRITGDFGSEVLRSVRLFNAHIPDARLFNPDLMKYVHAGMKTFNNINNDSTLSFTLFKQAPWKEHSLFAIQQSQVTVRTPFLDNDFLRLAYQAHPDIRKTPEITLRLIADGNPLLMKIMSDFGYAGTDNILSRYLRLYYKFLFKTEYAYNYGMPQWLARADYILKWMHPEKIFLGHHKFSHFRVWYRDRLDGYVKDILLDASAANRWYLNKKFLHKIIAKHIKGYGNYTTEITTVLTLELIHRLLIESDA